MSNQMGKPDSIKLKSHVPETDRTPGKDSCAEYIQTEVVERGRWPMDYSEIAEECGWSRQHVRNTLESHFVESNEPASDGGNAMVTISVPEGVDRKSYLKGWIDGMEQ